MDVLPVIRTTFLDGGVFELSMIDCSWSADLVVECSGDTNTVPF